jgi:hypothetical protein
MNHNKLSLEDILKAKDFLKEETMNQYFLLE